MARKKKAEAPLAAARVAEVLQLRLDGARRWDVLQFIAEKEREPGSAWALNEGEAPMSERMAGYYIAAADADILRSVEKDKAKTLARHWAQRRNLYAKAVMAGDNATALAVLKDEAKLADLYPTEKQAHTHTHDGKIEAKVTDARESLAPYAAIIGVFVAGSGPHEAAPEVP